jgi:hypothetical protein
MPKPPGILWHKLSPQKLGQIKVLRELRERIEQETGQTLPMGAHHMQQCATTRSSAPHCPHTAHAR